MINKDPNHTHTYDAKGKMTCCSLEEKIDAKSGKPHVHKKTEHVHSDNEEDHDDHDHDHDSSDQPAWRSYLPAIISFVLLMSGLVFDYFIKPSFFQAYIRLGWYIAAYLPVGIPVMIDAVKSLSLIHI